MKKIIIITEIIYTDNPQEGTEFKVYSLPENPRNDLIKILRKVK